jgi:hypothetical protein
MASFTAHIHISFFALAKLLECQHYTVFANTKRSEQLAILNRHFYACSTNDWGLVEDAKDGDGRDQNKLERLEECGTLSMLVNPPGRSRAR